MFELIGKQYIQFYAQKFCLSKPMIREYANYANNIICIFDHKIKKLVSKLLFGTNFSSL